MKRFVTHALALLIGFTLAAAIGMMRPSTTAPEPASPQAQTHTAANKTPEPCATPEPDPTPDATPEPTPDQEKLAKEKAAREAAEKEINARYAKETTEISDQRDAASEAFMRDAAKQDMSLVVDYLIREEYKDYSAFLDWAWHDQRAKVLHEALMKVERPYTERISASNAAKLAELQAPQTPKQ